MRKSKPKKRILLPDPKFNDVLVTRFVNDLMVDGKKSIAFRIFYDAIDIVDEKMAKKEEKPALDIWKQALENITPQVEVKEPSCRWCNIPSADGNQPDEKKSYLREKYDIVLSQKKRKKHGRKTSC